MAELRTDVNEIKSLKTSLEFTQEQVDQIQEGVTKLAVKTEEQDKKYETVMKQLAESKEENKLLKEKLLKLEAYGRRENLVFCGVEEQISGYETVKELFKKVTNIFVNKLGIMDGAKMDYQRCHRIGPKPRNDANKPRDVIVRFVRYQDREQVWSKRRELQGSNIFIKEDFPTEIDQRRDQLYPIMKAARGKNMKATVTYDKLIIDNKSYTINTLNELPVDLQPKSLATRHEDAAVLFYGRHSHFSNFFAASFTVDNITYSSSEQFYQYHKAMKAGDIDTGNAILTSSDPVTQYKLGKRIRINESFWNKELAKQIMEKGVKNKFEQNMCLKDSLIATGTKMLVECNPNDCFWSSGLKLNHSGAADKTKWRGENALGEILIKVREALK